MYSWEIKKYLQERDFRITPLEFMAIINTSPQIKHVPMDDDMFRITSDDGLNVSVYIIKDTPVKKNILKP